MLKLGSASLEMGEAHTEIRRISDSLRSKQFPKDIDQTDLHRRDILEFEADITKHS